MKAARTEGTVVERIRLWRQARAAGATIRPPFRLPHPPGDRPAARIVIEHGVFIGPRAWLNVQPAGHLRIGEGTAIGDSFSVSVDAGIDIGPGCLLSARVLLTDAQHDYRSWILPAIAEGREPRMTFAMDEPAPIRIGAGSWLGVGVVVLPGVEIGAGCVIGANSVVTRSIEPYTVAAGLPAVPVRRLAD